MASRSGLHTYVCHCCKHDNWSELIDLRNQALAELFQCEEEVGEDDLDMINMTMYVEDWYNVSHDAYHELAKDATA